MRFHYVCSDCGKTFYTDEIMYQCPDCAKENDGTHFPKGNLIVELEDDVLKAAKAKEHVTPDDFYPYPSDDPDVFPIGITPLMRPRRIQEKLSLPNLSFKLDSQLISGSFKDRASYEVALQAKAHGIKKIALASTGNAGAAMSAVGAAMDLDIILFVPASAPINKLMQSVLYGAHVVPVRGTYDDAFALSIAYTQSKGGVNRNTAYNPMTIEGKKAASIELFLQMGREVPDIIYVPTGDGCILGGIYKGFYDLLHAGLIEALPRIVCCQSDRSDAIAGAFETGVYADVKATTLADSISVSSPANGRMAVRAIRESGGHVVRVSDDEILQAQRLLCSQAGLFVEPASACAYAALLKDCGSIGGGEKATVLLTGTGFKDMAVFQGKVALPEAIDNSVEAVLALPF